MSRLQDTRRLHGLLAALAVVLPLHAGAVGQAVPGDAVDDKYDLQQRIERWDWIWEPPRHCETPTVVDSNWPIAPLDHFILHRLEAKGLEPAADASPEVWLRRVSYALVGLPPTPEAQAVLLADPSSETMARIVDELLASPAYGERWARHWMDLVRYAESRGHEEDYLIANAWHYRDYLIRAFNSDVPYDQFIREHIAGDLLPKPRRHRDKEYNESRLGTAWAFLGEEVHSPVDILTDECDRIDNKIDVLTKTFLGLTVSCARCHDHKFDAISQSDYYALTGFFLSSAYEQRRFDSEEHNESVRIELEACRDRWEPTIRSAIADAWEPTIDELPKILTAVAPLLAQAEREDWQLGPSLERPFRLLDRVWDFETDDLQGWRAVATPHGDGRVFTTEGNMPTTLPTPHFDARLVQGQHFIRTWDGDVLGETDQPTGILESEEFILGPEASFSLLVGGGGHGFRGDPDQPEADMTAVTLEIREGEQDWRMVRVAQGRNANHLHRETWDASEWEGRVARLRIYDTHQGGWGHIDVDDIRYHTADLRASEAVDRCATEHGVSAPRTLAWLYESLRARDDSSHPLFQTPVPPSNRLDLTTWLPADARVLANYTDSSPERATPWFRNGPTFGDGPVPRGTLRFGTPSGSSLAGIATETAALADPVWSRLTVAPGTERETGRLGEFTRSGRSLITPRVKLDSGSVYYLIRGALGVYASVDTHIMVTGALHLHLIQKYEGDSGRLRWVAHDLTDYAGHHVHFELAALDGSESAVLAVVESPTPPTTPAASSSTLGPVPTDGSLSAYTKRIQELCRAAVRWMRSSSSPDDPALDLADAMLEYSHLFLQDSGPLEHRLAEFRGEQDSILKKIKTASRTAPVLRELNRVDGRRLRRGLAHDPREITPRALPEAFAELSSIDEPNGSGRLALAERVADPTNPLTARVLVNRVWHHLFGRGLVPTVDNFGFLGERPTHPDLLDRLAHDFVHVDGWSIRSLIRRMVLSRTYRMSSQTEDRLAHRIDPSNDWLHKMRVRRIEGEALRDSILAISGSLDPIMYGPPIPVHLTPFVTGRGRPGHSGPLDGAGRRSIYGTVRRNFLPTMMTVYDTPIPFSTMGRRTVTNVPAQALVLMNDRFVYEQSKVWAKNLLANSEESTEDRIGRMYRACFCREPTASEIEACLETLEDLKETLPPSTSVAEVWAELGHALWQVKEFVYLR